METGDIVFALAGNLSVLRQNIQNRDLPDLQERAGESAGPGAKMHALRETGPLSGTGILL